MINALKRNEEQKITRRRNNFVITKGRTPMN